MSPNTTLVRRLLWTVTPVLALVGALLWLLGPAGPAGPGEDPDTDVGREATTAPEPLEEVPVEEATTEPEISLTDTADLGGGLTLRITRVESVDGVAKGVGEIAGPALRLTLRLSNDSDSDVSVDSAVVDLLAGPDRTPAATLTGPGGQPFEGSLPSKGSVTGVYVFGVPPAARDRVQVSVSYQGGAARAVFVGDVA